MSSTCSARIQSLEGDLSNARSALAQAESSRSFAAESFQRRLADETARLQRASDEKERLQASTVFNMEQEVRGLRGEVDRLRAAPPPPAAPAALDLNSLEVQVTDSIRI